MKLHFDANLDYQLRAIDAVCDLFRGQELCRSEFTVSRVKANGQRLLGLSESDFGVGNMLAISGASLLANLREIQVRNALEPSVSLDAADFTVEMETGTGKTYVYLRTIFELNKRYGFTKFVIVVPSIAIKEGVYKTLQMTEEHFRALYSGTPSEYFIYDSSKLGQVRNFATSPAVQIMVVTVGAINKKDVNNLYKEREETGDERPVDLIRATHPIIIVDEPQSVDGGLKGAGKSALSAMDPLCTLRYSATHVDTHHMVYRLDAVDAYERRLVKQIEVASATVEGAHNRAYVRLVSINRRRADIFARVVIDVERSDGVRREETSVHDGDDLERITGRALYRDCRIGELRAGAGMASMELRVPGGERFLVPGQAWGDVESLAVQREMIRRTIREHFDKELRLSARRIKVLSLFFVDAVDRYRRYDEAGNAQKGSYAEIFEAEYQRLAAHPAYAALFTSNSPTAAAVHNGYFSIDKRGGWTDTDESSQADRDSAERAYNLIMRDKEKLLSFETPLRFIFSHSALKEGWDNPNVFQICALRDMHSEQERRQTIGRGLRLCVNQDGDRISGFDPNTLTVIATESYERFAAGLQKEIEDATGRPLNGRIEFKNADDRRRVRPRPAVLGSRDFESLWSSVKYKTVYRVAFDNEQLIDQCVRELRAAPVPSARLQWRVADLDIGREGVRAVERAGANSVTLEDTGTDLPDILTELQDRTHLTRRTIQRVLSGSGRIDDFRRNPQGFIETAAAVLTRCVRAASVGGIEYRPLGNEHFYTQEILDQEIVGYLRSMVEDRESKSAYDHIVCDSEIEAEFARRLVLNAEVKRFIKLPARYTIPTPVGPYTPDWAVLIEQEGREKLCFVVETKGSLSPEDLRGVERAKIECGRAHYRALHVMEPSAKYLVARTFDDLMVEAT